MPAVLALAMRPVVLVVVRRHPLVVHRLAKSRSSCYRGPTPIVGHAVVNMIVVGGFAVADVIVACGFAESCMILHGGAAAAGMLRCGLGVTG